MRHEARKQRHDAMMAYLSHLGCENIDGLEAQIIGRVQVALRNSDLLDPPIRLTKVAECFEIQPKPVVDTKLRRAAISFDEASHRFVIRLARGAASVTANRFVYAHEFAHRFLFVPRRDGWVRAITLITDGAPPSRRLELARVLSTAEEQLCNRIANRLLLPDKALAKTTATVLSCALRDEFILWRLLETVARDFDVSFQCAFRSLSSRHAEVLSFARPDSVAFVVGTSEWTGAGKGDPRMRVIDSWWPMEFSESQLVRPYPGMDVIEFGSAFARFARRMAEGTSIEGEVRLPMTLPTKKGATEATLYGWWKAITIGHRRSLVYGRLSQ